MSSKKSKKSGSSARRAPQHRLNAGRHREASASVAEVVGTQANAGARLAAIGVLGSTTALAAPGVAAAAAAGGGQGAPGNNAAATMPMGMSQGAPVPYMNAFKPTIHITVVGDSYTSGEGANSSTYTTTSPVISPTGDMVPPLIYPQHNSNTSAINQAIAALQAANPGINIEVTNVAVSGASRVSSSDPSYPGTYFTQPAQLDAIKNADIIYNGFAGGNDSGIGPNGTPLPWNNFSEWGKTALLAPDSFLPTAWNSLYLPKFVSPTNPDSPGTNLPAQTDFLNTLAQLAPGATVITPGYPMPFSGKVADSWSIGSPFVSSLGPNAVKYSDMFAQWLSADAQAASGNANVANVNNGNTFLDVNMLNALAGHGLNDPVPGMNGVVPFSWGQAQMGQASFHPNPDGQTWEASAIYPVLATALQRIGGQQGFPVNTDPPASIQQTQAYQENAQGVQQQLSLITQFQQVSSLAQLAKQAQDGQTTNPDGSLTQWGQLVATLNLNGQQPSATWPDAQNGQAGQAGQSGQSGQAGQSGQDSQAAPGGDQRQPMADPVGGFLPPELSGATQNPPPASWTTAPQGGGSQGGAPGGAPQGGDQQGGSGGGQQDSGPQGTPQGGQQGAPQGGQQGAPQGGQQGAPQGGDQQNGAPQGQPGGSGDAAQPGGSGGAARPAGSGDTGQAAGGGSAGAGGSAAPAAPASDGNPAQGAPAGAPSSQPASPASFTSTPDPTGANPGAAPAAVSPAASVPAPVPVPAISTPVPAISTSATGITAPATVPTITPVPVVSNPAPVSTPGASFSSAPAFGDPAPVAEWQARGAAGGTSAPGTGKAVVPPLRATSAAEHGGARLPVLSPGPPGRGRSSVVDLPGWREARGRSRSRTSRRPQAPARQRRVTRSGRSPRPASRWRRAPAARPVPAPRCRTAARCGPPPAWTRARQRPGRAARPPVARRSATARP